ncbi:MAG: hypothetical protein M3Z04_05320 [Chloroflexota bacterium]|nr:hypothetical protein [Chloroflexota bacterium]
MINYWVARAEPPFAAWTALLPAPITPAVGATLLHLAHGILAAGTAAAVYEVQETNTPPGFHHAQHGTYAQFLAQQQAAGRPLPLFHLGSGVAPTASGRLVTPTRLSYFAADGTPTAAAVSDLGALLRELRPADIEWGSSYMARVAPVTISSPPLPSPGHRKAQPFPITISLLTDIWFPQVLALLEDIQPSPAKPRIWYSNAILAAAHTPRLNRFLAAVQGLVQATGGTWELDELEGTAQHYAPQVHATGIRLEAAGE